MATAPIRLHGVPYRSGSEVGAGAWGVVCRAVDPDGRLVALKRSHRPLTATQANKLVARMGPMMALGHHEHLARVIDAGLDGDGHGVIVTDLVDGRPSWSGCGDAPQPIGSIRQWAADIGGALDYLHAAGLVHGDVKPTNVLTRDDGGCVLADFDTLRPDDASDTITEVRVSYLFGAPEVLEGAVPNEWSDLYQYGASLYALATGSPPFFRPGEGIARFAHRVWHDPLPTAPLDRLPPDLASTIIRCLAREPDDRRRRSAGGSVRRRRRLATATTAAAALSAAVLCGGSAPSPAVIATATACAPVRHLDTLRQDLRETGVTPFDFPIAQQMARGSLIRSIFQTAEGVPATAVAGRVMAAHQRQDPDSAAFAYLDGRVVTDASVRSAAHTLRTWEAAEC